MADLVGAINNLKKLLQEKSRKKSTSRNLTEQIVAEKKPKTGVPDYLQEWEYKPPSSWMTLLSYIPIQLAGVQSGAVVMFVKAGRGNPGGYIYPRVPFKNFMKWMSSNSRGGRIYWYGAGTPALKEYSVATRLTSTGSRMVKGRIGRQQVKQRKRYFPTARESGKRSHPTMFQRIKNR